MDKQERTNIIFNIKILGSEGGGRHAKKEKSHQ
jgi:hypothetical protein